MPQKLLVKICPVRHESFSHSGHQEFWQGHKGNTTSSKVRELTHLLLKYEYLRRFSQQLFICEVSD